MPTRAGSSPTRTGSVKNDAMNQLTTAGAEI